MTRLRPVVAAGVMALAAVGVARAEKPELKEIQEDFESGGWDRHWWSVDQRSPPGVKLDLSGKSLRFTIPPGPDGRPPATMKGRFRLEGDFDIEARYEAKALPRPKAGWINVQVFIDGPAGPAAAIRTNHAVEGSGYSLWWEPAEEGVAGAWSFEPTESLQGALRLTRSGETVRFLYADNVARSLRERDTGADGFLEIGSVKYGSQPITHVELWVTVPETQSPVDVTFDNVLVRADRIVDPSVAADSAFGPRAWIGVVVLAALLAAAAAWWFRRSR